MSVRSNVRKDKEVPKEPPIPVIATPNSSNTATEFIYYEAQYINDTTDIIPASFSDSRTDAIVDNLSQYKMAVTRMSIGAGTIPLFTVRGNKPVCSVGLYYAPDNLSATADVFDLTPTLRVFEISNFLDATDLGGGLNPTIAKAFVDIQNQYDVIHGPGAWAANILLPQQPPAFEYNPVTNLISLYTPPQNQDNDPNHVDLYLSSDISPLFFGFTFYRLTYNTPFNTAAWRRIAINASFNQPTATVGGNSYLFITQDYSSVAKWYTFNKLLIVSDSLGVRNTYIGFIKASTTSNSSNTQFATIVDLSTNLDNSVQNNPATNITYIPQNIRWIDCLSTSPLKYISLSVNVIDEAGNFLPATIISGAALSITLAFAKISF
jgi:hypothetical protein